MGDSVKNFFHSPSIRPLVKGMSQREGTGYPGVQFSPCLLLTATQRSFHKTWPKSKQSYPLSTVQSSLTVRLPTFSRTKRDRVGSRKPKHALSELMTKAMRATLGKVMSFQNECSPGSESSGKNLKKKKKIRVIKILTYFEK